MGSGVGRGVGRVCGSGVWAGCVGRCVGGWGAHKPENKNEQDDRHAEEAVEVGSYLLRGGV